MIEIKYEPLYGLQKPFDNGPNDANAYGLFRDGDEYIYYKIDKTSIYCFDTDNQWSHIDGAPTIPFLAMRRIIRTPTWSVADQKAGKLPDVSCRVNFCHKLNANWRTGEIKYIDDQVTVIKADDIDRPFVYEVDQVEFKPIETPEEKAARLREEWCIKALSSCSISSEMQRYELKRLGGYIEDIYDALLSGDLPVPVKGA